MSGAADIAARRRLFERAVASGISMDAARAALARERWAVTDAQLSAKRGVQGTVLSVDEDAGRPLAWWQQ